MAYCIECGVKLGDAETKCPLCGTALPEERVQETKDVPFPIRTSEQTLAVNRKYVLGLLSLLLLMPAGLCLLLDLTSGSLSWSIYPAGVLLLIWIAVAVPLLFKRHRLNSTILITGASLAGYLYMVSRLSGDPSWFLPIVFPALVLFITMVCLVVSLVRKHGLRTLPAISLSFFLFGALSLLVELLCIQAGVSEAPVRWSPFVLSPCIFISVLFYFISRNPAMAEELRRRFHF